MTRTTRRLRRMGAVAVIGLATAAVVTGTALAADNSGDEGDGGGPGGGHSHLVAGTPCTDTARACVDLAHNQAWLIHEGHITRGPVAMSHGGQGKETPTGTFQVEWKDQNHKSAEFNNAAMPFSVFFAPGGIAFHQGNPKNPSAGCVHLAKDDAEAWFADLQVGEEVQVH